MTSAVQSPYSSQQIKAWLRGLLTIALADGRLDPEEREVIADFAKEELYPCLEWDSLPIIAPEELAEVLGKGTPAANNFVRTAFMVAIANGIYSSEEDQVLQQLCGALGQPQHILNSLRETITIEESQKPIGISQTHPDLLHPLRDWLNGLEIQDPRIARFLCKMIPNQCPFERDITIFGRKIVHIPPLCKLNPLYEQLVGLRFRALSYLADCGEDISPYITN